MKSSKLPTLIITLFIYTGYLSGQLTVDAGSDTAYCAEGDQEKILGGNPTAIGGIPPYTYSWSAKFQIGDHIWYASSMLNDTTLPNPALISGAIPDSIYFFLTVQDSIGSISTDSVKIRLSRYMICLADCILFIKYGDSTELWSCVDGGIGPYEYSWKPANSLSDSSIRNPWAKPTSDTEYNFRIEDAAGCVFESRCFVTVYPLHIEQHKNSNPAVMLHPNPTENTKNIYASVLNDKYLNTILELFSSDGRLVKRIKITESIQRIDLTGLAKGIYFYNCNLRGEVGESGTLIIR